MDADKVNFTFQELLDIEPDAMLVVDRQARIIVANKLAEELFGYQRDEFHQLKLDTLVPEQLRDQHRGNVARFFMEPKTRPMGIPFSLFARRKDGSEFPVDISLAPMKIGETMLVACSIRDISTHKQIEQTLRQREETYRALFEHANDAIFLISLEGIHLQVNQRAADLLGYSREELVGKGVRDLVDPDEYSKAQDRLNDLMEGSTLPLYERTFRKKDGSRLPVEINLSLVRNMAGEPIYIQSIVRDISVRKRAEKEQLQLLEEIRRSREDLRALAKRTELAREDERRLLAIELHDQVGQSLTGLNFNLSIIRSQLPQDALEAVRARISDSVKLLEETTRLIRNVMADLRPPMLDDFGLVSALGWYCQSFSQRIGIRVLVVGREPQPRLPRHVEIVCFRICQEALTNIAKHAHANQVEISIEDTESGTVLRIIDDGVGFEMPDIPAPGDRTHWGLLNIQERAASIGGRLSIQSALGQGTKVTIELGKEMSDD